MKRFIWIIGLGLSAACSLSWAADNYTANYQNAVRQPVDLASKTLSGLLSGIAAVPVAGSASAPSGAPVPFSLSLRGVSANLSGAPALLGNATVVNGQLSIPSTGANAQFTAPTWPEVMEQIKRFLQQGPEARRLQRESARSSPFDPVAGNPSSLMARMVANDFATAFSPFASNLSDGPVQVAQAGGLPAGAVRGPLPGLPGVGAQVGLLRDHGRSARSLTIPLSYTLRSDLDPRRQFSMSLPLTVADVDGARTLQGALGAAMRQPVTRDWALSGNAGFAIVRAADLGSAGKIGSLSLSSSVVWRGAGSDMVMGNLVGHYRTLGGTVNGVDTGSGISNTVFRNGLLWSMPAPSWLGFGRSIEYSVVNTHYTGTELYLRNYSELGLSIGSNKRADSTRSYMQGGLSVLVSAKTTGLLASYGYWF